MKNMIIGVIILIILAGLYYLVSPLWRRTVMNEASPIVASDQLNPDIVTSGQAAKQASLIYQADLKPHAHAVTGKVQLIQVGSEYVVRFEDYQAINGPDLRVYLATDNTAKDFIDLGKLKATTGNVNYSVPVGVDFNQYDTVLVWCRAFRTLFSYADLK